MIKKCLWNKRKNVWKYNAIQEELWKMLFRLRFYLSWVLSTKILKWRDELLKYIHITNRVKTLLFITNKIMRIKYQISIIYQISIFRLVVAVCFAALNSMSSCSILHIYCALSNFNFLTHTSAKRFFCHLLKSEIRSIISAS